MLRYLILALFIHLSVSASVADELSFLGGGLVASEPREHTYSWAIDYRHALSEHFAISGAWINEGHVMNHHRDGAALQIWAQTMLLDPALSLSVGVGPYYYFDTTDISGDSREVDSHKAGLIYSFAVTRRVAGSWLLHFRANRINTRSSIDTTSFMVGVGYDLDAHPAEPSAASRWDESTESEIAVMLGTTIVNSFDSETSFAKSIHYRRRLGRHLHGSIGWLNEGNPSLVRRNGIFAQLWAVRSFIDPRVTIEAGIGPYVIVDAHGESVAEGGRERLAGIISLGTSYRFAAHWLVRATWNRVLADRPFDSDVFLVGGAYVF